MRRMLDFMQFIVAVPLFLKMGSGVGLSTHKGRQAAQNTRHHITCYHGRERKNNSCLDFPRWILLSLLLLLSFLWYCRCITRPS
jgi:hypothetical protein